MIQQKTKIFSFLLLSFVLISSSCEKEFDDSSVSYQDAASGIVASVPPFDLPDADDRFYGNILYGSQSRQSFDLFVPSKVNGHIPPLVIFIHGGAFVSGDKTDTYGDSRVTDFINEMLRRGIAYASLNYRFLEETNNKGVKGCLDDTKYALQYIRYYADVLNIDPENIVLYGNSAGAGSALWLGTRDEMADTTNSNPILRESTRVNAIICEAGQASYDLLEWHNSVFSDYQDNGFGYNSVEEISSVQMFVAFYGVSSESELESDYVKNYRKDVDMISFISEDDPEIWMNSNGVANTIPTNKGDLYHHPLHAKAVMDKAESVQLANSIYAPQMGIDTRKYWGEVEFAFVKSYRLDEEGFGNFDGF